MIKEAIVWRIVRTPAMAFLIVLVAVVAMEWTSRQWLDKIVWLGWLELAGVLGFVCIACPITFVMPCDIGLYQQADN